MRSDSWLSPSISLTSSTSQSHYSYHYHQMHQNQWQENEPLQGTALSTAMIISWSVYVCAARYLSKEKCFFFSTGKFFFTAAKQKRRSENSDCDVSQLSLLPLKGPESIIGQKQGHILYFREAKTEGELSLRRGKGGYLLFCQSHCLKAEPPLQLATVTSVGQENWNTAAGKGGWSGCGPIIRPGNW